MTKFHDRIDEPWLDLLNKLTDNVENTDLNLIDISNSVYDLYNIKNDWVDAGSSRLHHYPMQYKEIIILVKCKKNPEMRKV